MELTRRVERMKLIKEMTLEERKNIKIEGDKIIIEGERYKLLDKIYTFNKDDIRDQNNEEFRMDNNKEQDIDNINTVDSCTFDHLCYNNTPSVKGDIFEKLLIITERYIILKS